MKNVIFLKIASLFIFFTTAVFASSLTENAYSLDCEETRQSSLPHNEIYNNSFQNNITVNDGEYLFIDGDYSLDNNSTITVQQGGTLVINGELKVNNQGADVIVHGTLTVLKKMEVKGNSTIVNVDGTLNVLDEFKHEGSSSTMSINGNMYVGDKFEVKTSITILISGSLNIVGQLKMESGGRIQGSSSNGGYITYGSTAILCNGNSYLTCDSTNYGQNSGCPPPPAGGLDFSSCSAYVAPPTLFFEDFEDEAADATTGTAVGNVGWSATTTASGYEESNVAEYNGDNSFWIELFNGNTTWITNTIDISAYENVAFSLDVSEYEDLESDDYIKTEYQIDGGAWTVAESNGYLNNDFSDDNGADIPVSQQNIEGDSLIIRVTAANNDNGDEEHYFDDILVQGQLKLPNCAINLAPTGNIQSLTPTLSWDAVSGATGYKVYYGTDSSTSTFVGETSSTSQVLPTLVNNTQYFWKVVPTNARGDASGCSAVSFTTIFPAPSCASYISPTDGAIDISLTPELSWSAVSGATGYKVYYSSDSSNLGNPITLGEVTSYQLPQLGYETQYFWKVVPFNTGGSLTLNSSSTEFASIIVEGTASGNITYNRFVNYQAAGEWDIIGPPVLNQNMQSFAQTNTNDNTTSGAMAMGGDYYALGQYLTQWGSWVNYTTSTIPNANFPAAKGYQMGTNSIGSGNDMQGQTLAFTGEIATTTQTINIQNQNGANGGNGRRWNLVANPFSSYINGNTNAGTTNGGTNFIDVNANVLDLEYTGLYYWDADEDGWDVFNQLQTNSNDGTLFIAPGQGFFVAARNSEVAQISFTPQMRTILGGDDFISGAPILLNYKLDLKLFNGSAERAKTKFHFQQGLTLGLDAGYDAGAYNQAAALSSRLPEDDQGVNFQLNAMNLEAAYNQSIPLVINQQEGQNFRVSISNNTLPEDVNVYLEDTQNGTLTSLKDQDFELIAQSDLSDAGRFYIRFTTQNLAVNDVLNPSSLTIFKLNTDAFVTIQGLIPVMGKTTATLYNMLGMKVREKALNNTAATQQISTQGLASGVYIINLKAGEQAISKKIIIQ